MGQNIFGEFFGRIILPEPPGRAVALVLLYHAGKLFQTPLLLTYVDLPEFDFINPDCHLLGKNVSIILENWDGHCIDNGRDLLDIHF